MRGIFMEIKEKVETEFVDYKRIFYGEPNKADEKTNQINLKKSRENKFIKVFFMQSIVCLTIIFSALLLKYAQPETFDSVSSVLNGFYENNITLSDLNRLIDDKITNNETVAAFFNFSPAQD